MNSVNRATKTWTVNVNISCLHPIMQETVRLNVVQHVLYFMNQVMCTSSLICSPPPSPYTLFMEQMRHHSRTNASSDAVLKPRMLFSILERADQKVQFVFTTKCSTLGKLSDCAVWWQPHVRRTHTDIWYLRVPRLAVGSHPEGAVDSSRSFSVSTGPLSRSRTCWPTLKPRTHVSPRAHGRLRILSWTRRLSPKTAEKIP